MRFYCPHTCAHFAKKRRDSLLVRSRAGGGIGVSLIRLDETNLWKEEHVPYKLFDAVASDVRALIMQNVFGKFQVVMLDMCRGHEMFAAHRADETRKVQERRKWTAMLAEQGLGSPVPTAATSTTLSITPLADSPVPKSMAELMSMSGAGTGFKLADVPLVAATVTPETIGFGIDIGLGVSPRALSLALTPEDMVGAGLSVNVTWLEGEEDDVDSKDAGDGFEFLLTPAREDEEWTPLSIKSPGGSDDGDDAEAGAGKTRHRAMSSARLSVRGIANPYSFLFETAGAGVSSSRSCSSLETLESSGDEVSSAKQTDIRDDKSDYKEMLTSDALTPGEYRGEGKEKDKVKMSTRKLRALLIKHIQATDTVTFQDSDPATKKLVLERIARTEKERDRRVKCYEPIDEETESLPEQRCREQRFDAVAQLAVYRPELLLKESTSSLEDAHASASLIVLDDSSAESYTE